jgi:Flp pilus assembly protein TadD
MTARLARGHRGGIVSHLSASTRPDMPFNPTSKPGRNSPSAGAGVSPAALLMSEAAEARRAGRNNHALGLCRQVLQLEPSNLSALALSGEIYLTSGRKADAEPLLARAVSLNPGNPALQHMLGVALYQLDRADEAVKALRRSVELSRDNADAWSALGASLQRIDRLNEALEAYEQATSLNPGDATIWVNRASAAMRLKDWANADSATTRALSIDPANRRGLAYRAMALTETGRREAAAEILDYDNLTRIIDLNDADAGGDLAALNAELVDHVQRHPDLTYEPVLKATKGGSQTPDLLAGDKGPVARLEAIMRDKISGYISEADPARHPYLAHAPANWQLIMWGTCLNAQGRQAPHIHPGAWLSGVYYAALPPEMGKGGDQQDGWIEFGRGGDEFPTEAEPVTRMFEPKEGRLILFPSFMFHRTIPFDSTQPRVSIAMDVEPVR